MKQLRVGIVGTGMAFERLHLPAFQRLTAEYRIVALCDAQPGKARSWARKLGIPEENVTDDPKELARRDDVDVIDILVPITDNFKVTEAVAREIAHSHKGIICEKPLAPDEEQARRARELPKKYGVPVLIAENYRYNEEIQLLRKFVTERHVGDVRYFIQHRVVDFPEDMLKDDFAATEWRQHPDFPGGVLLDTGVHDVAALHHVFGAIEEVHAFGLPQEEDFAPYSVVQANLRFRSGVIGQLTMHVAGKEMQRPLIGLRIVGSEGMIYLEERDCGVVNVAFNDGRIEQHPYTPQQGYYRELLNFHRHMTAGEPLQSPPEIEYGDVRALLGILRSVKEGKPIRVEPERTLAPVM